MCSLQEAWGDFNLTNSANNINNNNIKQQQIQMDMERQPSKINNERLIQDLQQHQNNEYANNENKINNGNSYYSQSGLRREYAQHSSDIFRPEYESSLMSKPPTGNSQGNMIRGIHNKYSREKRVANMSENNNILSVSSNVNFPSPLPRTLNDIPNYINELGSVEGKPYKEGPPNDMPTAHNSDDVNDAFLSVNDDYFDNNSMNNFLINHASNMGNNFTPEVITNSSVLNNINMNNNINNTNNSNNNNERLEKVRKDEPENIMNDEQIRKLKKQLDSLHAKIQMLENKLQTVETNRPHDIILIIVISLFILFIVDNIFRTK